MSSLSLAQSDDLRQFTRTVAKTDSEGREFTVRIPRFISKGGFFKRGEEAIVGDIGQKTLYDQDHRQDLYRVAFSDLIRPKRIKESVDFKNSFNEFDKELLRLKKTGSVTAETYDTIKASVQLAADGFNLASAKGDSKLVTALNVVNAKLKKIPNEAVYGVKIANATLDLANVVQEGLKNHKEANKNGDAILKRLELIRQHYVDTAGSFEEANKKYPAEMNALMAEQYGIEVSKGLQGALVVAIDNNKGDLLKSAANVGALNIGIKFGPAIKTASKKAVTKALLKAVPSLKSSVAGKLVAAGGTSLAVGSAIAVVVEKPIILSQIKQGNDAQLASVYSTIALDFEDADNIENHLLVSHATYMHNKIMMDATGTKLGKFHDFFTPEDNDSEVLDSYNKWHNHYKNAKAKAKIDYIELVKNFDRQEKEGYAQEKRSGSLFKGNITQNPIPYAINNGNNNSGPFVINQGTINESGKASPFAINSDTMKMYDEFEAYETNEGSEWAELITTKIHPSVVHAINVENAKKTAREKERADAARRDAARREEDAAAAKKDELAANKSSSEQTEEASEGTQLPTEKTIEGDLVATESLVIQDGQPNSDTINVNALNNNAFTRDWYKYKTELLSKETELQAMRAGVPYYPLPDLGPLLLNRGPSRKLKWDGVRYWYNRNEKTFNKFWNTKTGEYGFENFGVGYDNKTDTYFKDYSKLRSGYGSGIVPRK